MQAKLDRGPAWFAIFRSQRIMFGLFSRKGNRQVIDRLHGEIMAGVLKPALYLSCGVPDTFEGRFEMLVLHGALTTRRIEALPAPAQDLAQDLTDAIFRYLDVTLREMGVGDVTVPKKMKKHAESYAGRALSYFTALDAKDEGALREALARNVYGDPALASSPEAQRLAAYVHAVESALATYDLDHFLGGKIGYPDPALQGA
jgi:cytochrome b pre-mRNA-processing protein 3